MSDRAWVVVGSVLALGGLLAAAITNRPRPRSLREVLYLVIPLVGAAALVVLAWSRV